MYDFLDKYLIKSKNNLSKIIKYLNQNIEFLEQDLWTSIDEFNNLIDNIINIYYDKYFLYDSNDFSKIDKYIKFKNKINRKLKLNLLSIIDYFIENNKELDISKKESSLLYLTILMYIGQDLYNSDINDINNIENRIDKIINNFSNIRYRDQKDLNKLIDNIKDIVKENNNFYNSLEKVNNTDSYNNYIKINNELDYYKVLYQYNIKELNKYDSRDVLNVIDKLNIDYEFFKISFDLCYITIFKALVKGLNIKLLINVTKNNLTKFISLIETNKLNENILKQIKFVINYKELKDDYDFVNLIKIKNIDISIEIVDSFEADNYNLFMGIDNVILPEEFLSINEKYLEIWKDMGIFIIKKDLNDITHEEGLLGK